MKKYQSIRNDLLYGIFCYKPKESYAPSLSPLRGIATLCPNTIKEVPQPLPKNLHHYLITNLVHSSPIYVFYL